MKLNLRLSSARISALVFLLAIFITPILIFAVPKPGFSEVENKELAKFPTFSAKTLLNKTFMSGFETYSADHFPARPQWIELQTRSLLTIGQKEVNGVYILKDRLIEKIDEPEYPEYMANSVMAMKEFAGRFSGSTYLMLAPTAAEIYRQDLPFGAPTLDESQVIRSVYDSLKDDLSAVDVYSSMTANRDSGIYYRSDHHWTSRGAYLGYSALSNQLGFTAIPLDLFDIEHASHEFRGSLYSKVVYDSIEADTIDIYSYPEGPSVTGVSIFTGQEWQEHDGLYFREYLEKKDKYATFLGPNQPIVTITTDCPTDKELIVFKDSYAHSLAPFLAQHYSKITLVDLRYLVTSFENYVDPSEYDQALFCYNVKNFIQEDYIRRVNLTAQKLAE